MLTKIAIAAGDIWNTMDREEGILMEKLFEQLESADRPRDLLLMALGWLIYQKHVKWVRDKNGSRLYLVSSAAKEGIEYEKSDQDSFAFNSA